MGERPARWCWAILACSGLDRGGEPQGSFVIWPDNLFDNGSLHDYAGRFFEDQGYMSHPLDRHPTLAVFDDGRIQRI